MRGQAIGSYSQTTVPSRGFYHTPLLAPHEHELVQPLGCLTSKHLPIGDTDDTRLKVAVVIQTPIQETGVEYRGPHHGLKGPSTLSHLTMLSGLVAFPSF
jgi:hypothetical protein